MIAKTIRTCFPIAAAAVSDKAEEINKLNVFPVPDGDTGTNMSLTLASVTKELSALPADADMEAILAEGLKRAPYSCVMHCFSSGPRLAEAALEMGFYLSMSGIAAFPKSQEIRDIFARVPLDRVLVETDSPYLAPPPFRGRRNEPAYVAHTAKKGAEVFGISLEDFARATSANFDRLFTRAAGARKAA